MNSDRRKFMSFVAGSAAAGTIMTHPLGAVTFAENNSRPIKAIAFDAFPIFDPRAAFKVIKEQFPEQGDVLRKTWFNKIFGYTWLRTSANKYKNFSQVMEDALEFSAASMKLDLTLEKRNIIMEAFLHLPVWPDVKPALEQLQSENIRLAFLSNMTEDMLRANMRHNDIEEYFEFVLSTDRAQAFKPAPKAYQLAMDAFALQKNEIAFAAFAGWDAAGANWFGYPTIWVNRMGFPAEELDATPQMAGRDMNVLTEFVQASK